MEELPDGALLYLSDSRGVFIPQAFCEQTKRECVRGVADADWQTCLAGPDGEWYWEAWESILGGAIVTAPDTGQTYCVYQDGDCWLLLCDARGCLVETEEDAA